MNETLDIPMVVQRSQCTRVAKSLTQSELGALFGLNKQLFLNREEEDHKRQNWLSAYDLLTPEDRELVLRISNSRRLC